MCLSEQKPKIYASTVALVELAAARPAHDAWMAQADAALVASQQHFGQLHRRLERLAVAGHDRPCREEVSAIAAKAAEAELEARVTLPEATARHTMEERAHEDVQGRRVRNEEAGGEAVGVRIVPKAMPLR